MLNLEYYERFYLKLASSEEGLAFLINEVFYYVVSTFYRGRYQGMVETVNAPPVDVLHPAKCITTCRKIGNRTSEMISKYKTSSSRLEWVLLSAKL